MRFIFDIRSGGIGVADNRGKCIQLIRNKKQ